MDFRRYIVLLGLFTVSGTLSAQSPNIILILADDQGWTGTSVPMDPNDPEQHCPFRLWGLLCSKSFQSTGVEIFSRPLDPGIHELEMLNLRSGAYLHAFIGDQIHGDVLIIE